MFDHFYITDLGWLGYFFIYSPLSLLIIRLIYKKLLRHLVARGIGVGVSAILIIVALGAPMWDVYQIGQETKRLCEEKAGMHVYKTVEADGFIGGPGIDLWSKHGYSFLERYGIGNKKFRYTLKNGKEVAEEIQEFTLRYGFNGGVSHQVIGAHHAFVSTTVGDVESGEVFGDLSVVKTYPGWIDNLFIALTGTGSGFTPWLCGNEPPKGRNTRLSVDDLILETIKPHAVHGK